MQYFRGPSSSSRPSSELWDRPTDAPDVCESIPVTRNTVALPARVECRKLTALLKMIWTIRIVSRT
eukprot:831821-Pyramimonas_sp.AAC.1